MTLERRFLTSTRLLVLIAAPVLTGHVHATLIDLGGGMIYDSAQNITWLQDSNHALHQGLGGRNGQMTWADADAWAKSLVFRGNSGWRLPHGPTAGTSEPVTTLATGGELYNLYYQLGNTPTSGWKNKGPFSMAWAGSFWTDLNAGWTTSHHWIFDGSLGSNYLIGPDSNIEIVWLVRDGKATVPDEALTVSFAGKGKGKVVSQPAGISATTAASAGFPAGSSVALTVTPAAPGTVMEVTRLPSGKLVRMPMQATYTFAGWSGDASACAVTQNTCSITMDKAKNVTVTFDRKLSPIRIRP